MAKGRPSKFTQAIADEICERLAKGEPLTVICRGETMPTDRTVRNWVEADSDLSSDIADARVRGFDAIASRTRETARGLGDSTADVQRDKLIIETDLKLLAKWDPKRYGDKVALTGGGPEDAPIQHAIALSFVKAPGGHSPT